MSILIQVDTYGLWPMAPRNDFMLNKFVEVQVLIIPTLLQHGLLYFMLQIIYDRGCPNTLQCNRYT